MHLLRAAMPSDDASDLPEYRRRLERQRQTLAAGPPRADSSARLVRLDVELCCLEAALRTADATDRDRDHAW